MTTEKQEDDFWREVYSQCFQEKRHYDLMSWTIGGAITLINTLLISQMFKLPDAADPLWPRVGIALAVSLLCGLWWSIYERNRFWGEVCNETAREIERKLGKDGLGHAYMRGALLHEAVLRNVDVAGSPLVGPDGPFEQRIEFDMSRRSVHIPIRLIIFMPALVALAYAGFSAAATLR